MSSAIYIRQIPLQKVKELLVSSEPSISEIVCEFGFKTPFYFSQVFKETFGKSLSWTLNKFGTANFRFFVIFK